MHYGVNGVHQWSGPLRNLSLPSSKKWGVRVCIFYIFLRNVFAKDRQRGRILGLRLSLFSSQGFYKKIDTLEIELGEVLLK